MTSSRPYLIRALYEWIVDNGMTPYVLVDATHPGVLVPESAIQEGKVTLNISIQAVQTLDLGNDAVSFSARFNGVARPITLPIQAVTAVYARENGQGMMFPAEQPSSDESQTPATQESKLEKSASHLKVVK